MFCLHLRCDGDDRLLLDAWDLLNRLTRQKHSLLLQSIDVNVIFSHIMLLKELLQNGIGSDTTYTAFPGASHLNMQQPLTFEEARNIWFMAKLMESFPREHSRQIFNKLDKGTYSFFYQFFLRELIICYTGQIGVSMLHGWFDLAETWTDWARQGFLGYSDMSTPPAQLPGLEEISKSIQADQQNALLKFISLIPRLKSWPRLAMSHLMFTMICHIGSPACLADLISDFKEDPRRFFKVIGTCPHTDRISEKLDAIFQFYFQKWIQGLLRDYGYLKPNMIIYNSQP